jgi:hypothetical protein
MPSRKGVIPTVPFDLIFSVLVGLVFAACARQQFTGGAAPWGRELAAVLSYEAIIVWPVGLYFYVVFPDWSWMYFVDPERLPWGISVLVFLGYLATLLGGYLAGWALLRARQEKVLYGVLGSVGLVLTIFTVVCRRRLLSEATFDQFRTGHSLSVAEGKLVWAILVTIVGVTGAGAVVGFTLWEQGKRFRE